MLLKSLNSVDVDIHIDGESCNFIWMNLKQSMTTHHEFEIGVTYHTKTSVWAINPDVIFQQLGLPVTIKIRHIESSAENNFQGIITDIEIAGVEGDEGTVILRGGSPTILLDRDPSMGSYVDLSLNSIVTNVLKKTNVNIEIKNNIKSTQSIPYIARYRESSYGFLSRILSSFGEWFYYDGSHLIVGDPHSGGSKRVSYDIELKEIKLYSGMRNLNVNLYDYNPAENNYMESFPPRNVDGRNLYTEIAGNASSSLYPTTAKLPSMREMQSSVDLNSYMRTHHSRNYSQMSVFTAKSVICDIKLGDVITAVVPPSFKGVKFFDLGDYRVIEIVHHISRNGYYENEFKGIVGLTEALPSDHIALPTALPEPATVVDNADPRNQGRVKVRYFWHQDGESTHWLRVQTPDAGQSSTIPTNRGMLFIPELGDQVMVGFQQGDPSRPFVMGSLFHKSNSSGASDNNTIRTISTKSGHLIEFNDDESGDWGITIKDINGNVIRMDTKGKSIEISAPETITFNANEININAERQISAISNDKILINSTENISLNTKQMIVMPEEECSLNTKKCTTTAESVEVQSTKENLVLSSGKEVVTNSKSKKIKLS